MRNLCFIDIETTGSIFNFHEIIDIGCVKCSPDGNEIFNTFECRFMPKYPKRLTNIAKKINNFSIDKWKNSPFQSKKIWLKIIEFWDGCTPICHNPSFERAFLTLAANKTGLKDLKLDYHWIGTESIGWYLYTNNLIEKMSLDSLASYYNLSKEKLPHIAINGALLCREVYLKLIENLIL